MRRMQIVVGLLGSALVLGLLGAVPASSAKAAPLASEGEYLPLRPTRVVDTRTGLGLAQRKLTAGSTTRLRITGRGGVPAIERDQEIKVLAVALTVTVLTPSADGKLVLYRADRKRPGVFSVVFSRGRTTASMVTAAVDADGMIKIYNSAGRQHVLIDVLGFYTRDDVGTDSRLGRRTSMVPFAEVAVPTETRLEPQGALRPGESVRSWVDLADPVVDANVRAFWVVITAVRPQRGGYLTAWGPGSRPKVSTTNFTAGQTTSISTIVATTPCRPCGGNLPPSFTVRNASKGRVHVRVEVLAAFVAGHPGLRLQLSTPRRISDSRTSTNGTPLRAGVAQTVTVPADRQHAISYTGATLTTLSVLHPTASSRVLGWDNDASRPDDRQATLFTSATHSTSGSLLVPTTSHASYEHGFRLLSDAGRADFTLDYLARFATEQGESALAVPRVGAAGARRLAR